MDARVRKLALVFDMDSEDAQALVDAGLDTPRKVKAGIGKAKLPKRIKDKVKARQ